MKKRELGRTGIRLSEIGLGTWQISGDVWGPKDDAESIRALQAGLDLGANFIDTAAGYGSGHSEELVGEVLRSNRREEVIVSTKVKPLSGVFAPPPEHPIGEAYPRSWIRSECEESLRRLATDYIDILFIHTWNKAWAAETEWADEMRQLKDEGKIRAIGISIPDEGIADANVAVATGLVDVVQCVYSPFQQEPEYTLIPLAARHGVGIIARSPFSSGAIVEDWSGASPFADGDWRASWPLDVKPGWLDDQRSMGAALRAVLDAADLGHAEGALRYVLAHDAVSSVIPGSANPAHVKANLAASGAGALPDAVIGQIKELWLDRTIHGTYNGSI